MYLNFDRILRHEGMTPQSLLLLQAIHQQRGANNEDYIAMLLEDDVLEDFLERGLVEKKGKKGDSDLSKLRTSKKGVKFLLSLQKDQNFDDEDVVIAEWVEKVYKKRPNYVKSNMAELKRRLNWFKVETGIYRNELSALLNCFIQDSFVDDYSDKRPFNERFREFKEYNKRAQLSNKTENILFTPKDRYQRHCNLEQSPLWQYYQENQKYIEDKWKSTN